jgi:predicted Zn finger-like uncharacterized protein|tara:strand:- start:508 stop:984 length:477 start_codon:yes stop_codon:yes gene_type:complete
MIIACVNCNKKFDIDEGLIPDNGRLLQCSSCSHKWFFKNIDLPIIKDSIKSENLQIFEPTLLDKDKISEDKTIKNINKKTNTDKKETTSIISIKNKKKQKKSKFLSIILIFIISFSAFIILIDTFKYPISLIFPNIEFLLYNLYNSINDFTLFFIDLF